MPAARHLACTEQIIRDVRADSGTEPAEFNGEPARAHLPVNVPPTVAIPLARSLNGVSSRRLRQEFPGLRQYYRRARRLRSGSYFAGPVGAAPTSVPQHIEQQDPPA